jgi:DNA (cytosine-5)-methyltransferase 1
VTVGSLFSGIGGLELGLEMRGFGEVIWQAESDPHARAVLAKHWPSVRCFEDVREIDATSPRPDIICGGFPCQDISLAGRGAGIDGERSGLWREFERIVRVLRPGLVFIENVAALLGRGLDRVLRDLAALGFDAEWETFRASDVGAPHRRDRLFLLAYADRERVRELCRRSGGASGGGAAELVHDGEALAHAEGDGRGSWRSRRPSPGGEGEPECALLAYGSQRGPAKRDIDSGSGDGRRPLREGEAEPGGRGLAVADPDGPRDRARQLAAHRFPPSPGRLAGWDGPQPAIRRGDDGVPGRSHRLRLLGNAVVPQQAALAFQTLVARASPPSTDAGASETGRRGRP